jgi:6-phosphogluconate dehydrogenase
MGANMAIRLMKAGHECVVYDSHPEPVQVLVTQGAKGSTSLTEFVKSLSKPRALWLMVPAAAVDSVLSSLTPLLEPGDILIDGGNSYYHDDIRRAAELKKAGLHYADVGVSGGVWGLERGYCQMIGCEPEIVHHLDPIFRALAPGVATAPRTEPSRTRLSVLRAKRWWSFRQNGPQWHRIWHHGCLFRRFEHHQKRQCWPYEA